MSKMSKINVSVQFAQASVELCVVFGSVGFACLYAFDVLCMVFFLR